MRHNDLIIKIAARISKGIGEEFTEEQVKRMLEAHGKTADSYWQFLDETDETIRNWKPGTKPAPSPGDPDYDLYLRQTVPYEYGHILNPRDDDR